MKTKLDTQIKQLESSITWIENGTMLRTQKQRFHRLMNQGRVLDAYALIDEYKITNTVL
jgi:membrane protease subunit (stomatin/prohibitin family)